MNRYKAISYNEDKMKIVIDNFVRFLIGNPDFALVKLKNIGNPDVKLDISNKEYNDLYLKLYNSLIKTISSNIEL